MPEDKAAMEKLGAPAMRLFFGLAKAWQLTQDEQMRLLGVDSAQTLERWESGDVGVLNRQTIERISYMIGIFGAVNTLFPVPERADAWMRAPNGAALLGGRSALEVMASGNIDDLQAVRRYLDAQIN